MNGREDHITLEQESDSGVREAYAGIDMAITASKRLPVCVAVRDGERLEPLPLRSRSKPRPPHGIGNRSVLCPAAVERFTGEVSEYLHAVENTEKVSIRTVAIDAPREPKRADIPRRKAECAMDQRGISCFATPSAAEFAEIRDRAQRHLEAGGPLSRLRNSNRLWMLAGFALFEELAPHYECIEVYPQATVVAALDVTDSPKSTRAGMAAQVKAAAAATGWPSEGLDDRTLKGIGYGLRDDKVDAYLSAWVASLPEPEREPCGEAPHDVIWIPRMSRPGGLPGDGP